MYESLSDCRHDFPSRKINADKAASRIDGDDNVVCKHGPSECIGNMLSLCAKYLFPNQTIISLGFTNCLIASYSRIADRELVESCALEHGIDFEALNDCVSEDGRGIDLLRDSIERSEAADVKRSCTVRVNGTQWCIRDGGKWKGCDQGHEPNDLVSEIVRLYEKD